MSAVIKQDLAALAIDRLPTRSGRPVEVSSPDPRIQALEAYVGELERTLAEEREAAERTVAGLRSEATLAVADARAAGRAEVVTDEGKRLAVIERGVAEAVAAWRERLASIDGLAADLAAAAVSRIFGDGPDLRTLVARTLAHNVEQLGAHSLVRVAVSAEDFAEPETLAALAGIAPALVSCHGELPAGACRVTLRLGMVDLDPVAQWSVLDAALREMSAV